MIVVLPSVAIITCRYRARGGTEGREWIKTMKVAPDEFIRHAWTSDPEHFKIDPRHLILGPNTWASLPARRASASLSRKSRWNRRESEVRRAHYWRSSTFPTCILTDRAGIIFRS